MNTVTFYATLFSDTSSFVTPIEEIETELMTITETYTITRTILPTPSASLVPTVLPSASISTIISPESAPPALTTIYSLEPEPSSVVVTQTLYTTFTNFVTLFQGSDTVVTNLEEIVSNVVTMTVPAHAASSFTVTTTPTSTEETYELMTSETTPVTSVTPVYTTREVVSTQTHYLTLFNNDESILSSIEEVVTHYVTELSTPLTPSLTPVSSVPSVVSISEFTPFPEAVLSPSISSSDILLSSSEIFTSFTPFSTTTTEETTSEISTYHPELVPSIRTIFSTLTFYTTYYSDTSSIVASQEEVLTSYVTLFVPPSLITSATTEATTEVITPTPTIDPSIFVFTTTDYSTLTLYTTLFSGDEIVVISSEHVVPEVITATITPSSTSPEESSTKDESVLTFLTTFTYYTTYFSGTDPVIASSESVVTQFVTIEAPPVSTSTTELSIETTPVDETIIGVSTASAADIVSSFDDISSDIQIIGVSSAVATGTEIAPSIETKIEIESKIHTEIGTSPPLVSPTVITLESVESSTLSEDKISSEVEPSIVISSVEETIIKSMEDSKSLTVLETPILPVTTSSILTENVEIIGLDGKVTSLIPSDTLLMITGTDGFVTKSAEKDTAALSPVYISPIEEVSSASTSDIKPATVIELSDLLGGSTALGGNIGLAIEDIVSLITGKKNKTEEGVTAEQPIYTTEKESTTTEEYLTATEEKSESEITNTTEETTTEKMDTEKVPVMPKDLDYPIFVLPSSDIKEKSETDVLAPVYVPTETISTSSVEISSSSKTSETTTTGSKISKSVSTSVITGARTVFIVPTKVSTAVEDSKDKYKFETREPKMDISVEISNLSEETKASTTSTPSMRETPILPSQSTREKSAPSYKVLKDITTITPEIKKMTSLSDIRMEISSVSSMSTTVKDSSVKVTPELEPSIGTSVVTGAKTVFFEPDSNKTPKSQRDNIFASAKETILGRANAEVNASKSFTTITKDGQTVVSRTTSGATTIFFPGQIPKYTMPVISTRYITSVESITRTLALTTTRTYYTRDSTLTVPSVYTTTIPPRTFVSTIIGSRTILGILPEPTETVQIHKTLEPSERTTTVTTTTLIFNSIPSTVIRTLVLPTGVPTKTVGSAPSSSYAIPGANVFNAGTEKPAKPPEVADSTVITSEEPFVKVAGAIKPVQKARDETYLRAANPRIHDDHPDMRINEEAHRPPIVVTDSVRPEDDPFLNGRNGICDPKCQPYKKEICKEEDGFWTCQCRPGHARRDDHEICKGKKSFNTQIILIQIFKRIF